VSGATTDPTTALCTSHAICLAPKPSWYGSAWQSMPLPNIAAMQPTSDYNSTSRHSDLNLTDFRHCHSLPRLRTKFGEQAFSHAGPATWNALPDHISTVADPVKLQKLLKSHYFSQAFNIC